MSERDELADELADSIFRYTGVTTSSSKSMADELLAAGYRKPQQVTTVEELDALPPWSVVRSEQATIWEKFGGILSDDFWAETMTLGKHPSSHISLPATVLYEPLP